MNARFARHASPGSPIHADSGFVQAASPARIKRARFVEQYRRLAFVFEQVAQMGADKSGASVRFDYPFDCRLQALVAGFKSIGDGCLEQILLAAEVLERAS